MGELEAELAALCRGRGVMEPNLRERVGPTLMACTGIDPSVSSVEFRKRLTVILDQAAEDLADDLGLVFRAGLGLRRNMQGRFLAQRLARAAGELGRHQDTVRDYLNTAIAAIAAVIGEGTPDRPHPVPITEPDGKKESSETARITCADAGHGYPPGGWHLARLRTFLDLAGAQPVALEERTVVADKDNLAVVTVATTIRRPRTIGDGATHDSDRIDLAVVYGGSMVCTQWLSATYLRYDVRLPSPLCHGETHEFGVRLAIPHGQPFDPRYVFTPLLRCDEFDLKIRFAVPGAEASGRKTRIWRLAGLPPGLGDDFAEPAEEISPDTVDEIRLQFRDLRVGLAYGARWVS